LQKFDTREKYMFYSGTDYTQPIGIDVRFIGNLDHDSSIVT